MLYNNVVFVSGSQPVALSLAHQGQSLVLKVDIIILKSTHTNQSSCIIDISMKVMHFYVVHYYKFTPHLSFSSR